MELSQNMTDRMKETYTFIDNFFEKKGSNYDIYSNTISCLEYVQYVNNNVIHKTLSTNTIFNDLNYLIYFIAYTNYYNKNDLENDQAIEKLLEVITNLENDLGSACIKRYSPSDTFNDNLYLKSPQLKRILHSFRTQPIKTLNNTIDNMFLLQKPIENTDKTYMINFYQCKGHLIPFIHNQVLNEKPSEKCDLVISSVDSVFAKLPFCIRILDPLADIYTQSLRSSKLEGGKKKLRGFAALTVAELKKKAAEKNLKGYHKMNKAELVDLLRRKRKTK
jgi:hypothetical protein